MAEDREYWITLGRYAQDALKNPAFEYALERVMMNIQSRFLATTAEEEKERLALWAMGQHSKELVDVLRGLVDNAEIEEANKAHER